MFALLNLAANSIFENEYGGRHQLGFCGEAKGNFVLRKLYVD